MNDYTCMSVYTCSPHTSKRGDKYERGREGEDGDSAAADDDEG